METRTQTDATLLFKHLHSHVHCQEKKIVKQSMFSLRKDEASAKNFFQFYGFLTHQQCMLQVCDCGRYVST